MTEYGPEIAVNGVRPKWLADDDTVIAKYGIWAGFSMPAKLWAWNEVKAIRLPADHWAYPVIAKGFEPWAGGNSAPDDWDGCDQLARNGRTGFFNSWKHPWHGGVGKTTPYDIIGYRRKAVDAYAHADGSRECRPIGPDAPLTYKPETHVLFERMTEEQWASLWHMNTPHALGHFFGIIKPAPDPIAEYATKHSLDEAELRALLEAVKC